MSASIHLLTEPVNFAVVQMEGRKFPGVVVQGDTLNSLLARLNSINDRLIELGIDFEDEARADLDTARDQLDLALQFYEKTLSERGLKTPYQHRTPLNIDHGSD